MTIENVGVVGLGLLGRGIAACLVSHGFRVFAYEHDAEQRESATRSIAAAMRELIDLAGFPEDLEQNWSERYSHVGSMAEFQECQFVIESVTEDLQQKKQVFDQLEKIVDAHVPIASNTSALPITTLQAGQCSPQRFLGMHWAEPAYATRFLELIRGADTGDNAFESAISLARRCGKEVCVVNSDVPGFIANRLGYALYREALHLLETGVADAETIDRSFRNAAGVWAAVCGPLRWIDVSGGPELYAKAMQPVLPTLSNATQVPESLARLAEKGARGIENGQGFYSYTPDAARHWQEQYHHQVWNQWRSQSEPPFSERNS